MQQDMYKRFAQMESMIKAQKAESEETLNKAYQKACEARDEKEAADLARKIRNRLLEKSDSQMALDRLSFDCATATKFIASLSQIFSGEWAKYRQELRDLPLQEGFPFNVKFPEEPEKTKTNIN